jgi:hypothetical protein
MRSKLRRRDRHMRVAARQAKASAHDGHVLLDAGRIDKALDEITLTHLRVGENFRHTEN